MNDTGKKMATKEKLAQELEKLSPFDGQDRLVKRARAGMYDDFDSPLDMPQMSLVEDLRKCGQMAMVQRVIHGDFDSTKEEADAWAASPEGRSIFQELVFGSPLPKEAARDCPHCGESNMEQVGTSPTGPKTGDASLCYYCAKWSVYDAELTLRKPTVEETESIQSNDMAQRAEEVLRHHRKQ